MTRKTDTPRNQPFSPSQVEELEAWAAKRGAGAEPKFVTNIDYVAYACRLIATIKKHRRAEEKLGILHDDLLKAHVKAQDELQRAFVENSDLLGKNYEERMKFARLEKQIADTPLPAARPKGWVTRLQARFGR